MASRRAVVVDRSGLDQLIGLLRARGYATRGPVVRDGAVVPGDVASSADLPVGHHDAQAPGRYSLEGPAEADSAGRNDELFGWAVGPASWKADVFPPVQTVWRAQLSDGRPVVREEPDGAAPVAVVGARPCEVAALSVLDTVLADGPVADPTYARRRWAAFVVTAECGAPAATCFCSSMTTGPAASGGFDLALTEIRRGDGNRYLVRSGSSEGAEVLGGLTGFATPSEGDWAARSEVSAGAGRAMTRRLDTAGLPDVLARNQDHPRWAAVGERCLSCGNCTLVCPTCFCTSVEDTTTLYGEVTRTRRWASCFELDHSYLHGGSVRTSPSSRYRQWLTHKLSTWVDQFGASGCVGCGRCITWCPVGIDLTEEAAAIRASDGAQP
ncbi:MAG TPA: 4Fe-4S dicluster domain-containing protein [Acidimicrobiales bacterium]|nr:4Fe-4S dicluster domain-containing protein [Acidimicrobiales bacterium]